MSYAQYRDPTSVMGRRIIAYVIDATLAFAIVVIAFFALADSVEVPAFIDNACDIAELDDNVTSCFQIGDTVYLLEGADVAFVWLAGFGMGALNSVLLQGATGASVGKQATALRVVNASGQVCGLGRALVRWLLLIVDAYFCFLIGLITAFVSKGHQRVGDMVAKTYVVSARDMGVPPVPPVDAMYAGYATAPAPTPQAGWTPPGGWAPPPGPGAPPPPPPFPG